MDQLLMPVRLVEFHQTERANCTDRDGAKVAYMVRCYKHSPSRVLIQLRGATAKRGQLADTTLKAAECKALAAKLLELAELIDDAD